MSGRLFHPDARATNWLLIVGLSALGYALYLRYLVIEQPTVGLACQAGLDTWLCLTRRIVIALFTHLAFGVGALIIATLNLLRPSIVLFGAALAVAAFGVVLYNINLSALAVALLILGLARRAPATE